MNNIFNLDTSHNDYEIVIYNVCKDSTTIGDFLIKNQMIPLNAYEALEREVAKL